MVYYTCIYLLHIAYMKYFAFLFLLSSVLFAAPALAVVETALSIDFDAVPVPEETPSGLECIQDTIDTRDEAMIAALDTYYTTTKAALEKRVIELRDAWEQPKGIQRKADLKNVWTVYKLEVRKANKDFRLEKRSIWATFKKEKMLCRGIQVSDDIQSQSADTLL